MPSRNDPWGRILRLETPISLAPESYFASLLGLCALVISIALQVMLTAIFIATPLVQPNDPTTLTDQGRSWFSPEIDSPMYIIGCGLATALTLILVWAWHRHVNRLPANMPRTRLVNRAAVVSGLGALISLFLFLGVFLYLRPPRNAVPQVSLQSVLALLAPLGVVLVTIALLFGFGTLSWLCRKRKALDDASEIVISSEPNPEHSSPTARMRAVHYGIDVLVICGIIVMLYIPRPQLVAGGNYLSDGFFHWDFFAMGPAIAYRHGAALGTDVSALYGIGWALVFDLIASISHLRYTTMIFVAVLSGCLYFGGVYIFLRLLLKNVGWALTGTLLAIWLQMFNGLGERDVMWYYPSSSVMRYVMDIWVLIALTLHFKQHKSIWFYIAALLTGIALFLETDSGVALVALVVCYWLVTFILFDLNHRGQQVAPILRLFIGLGIIFLIWIIGSVIGSRGTILHAEFWEGMFGELLFYRQGFSQLALVSFPDNASLLLFVVITATYLGVFESLVAKTAYRVANVRDVMLGCLGFYGLIIFVLFVGRSHPWNIFHPSVPFSLVVASLAVCLWSYLETRMLTGHPDRLRSGIFRLTRYALPFLGAGLVLILLFFNMPFRHYPNLIQMVRSGATNTNLCLMGATGDVCELPDSRTGKVREFETVVTQLSKLARNGKSVLLLDDVDTHYSVAADIRPWGRYSPTFPNLFTRQQVQGYQVNLVEQPPDYVLIRKTDEQSLSLNEADVYRDLKTTVQEHFELMAEVGPFEIWKKPNN